MSIQVECPNGHRIKVKSRRAGTTVRCPACREPVNVPALPAAAAGGEKQSPPPAPPVAAPPVAAPPVAAPPMAAPPIAAPHAAAPPVAPPPVAPATASGAALPPAGVASRKKPRAAKPAAANSAAKDAAATESVATSESVTTAATAVAPGVEPPAANPQPGLLARLISDVPGYRAEKHRREAVYLLAAVVAGLACFSLAPAARHFDLGQAPGWARVVWLLALLQLAYAVWLALAPDWSATWVTTLLLAIVAAIYATAMAITLTVAPGHETILGLSDAVRTSGNKPTLWCGANVLLASLLAYLSGLLSLRWHRAYRRLNAPPSA